jgi:hypothetical protein
MHGCLGNLKFFTSTTDELPQAVLKCRTNSVHWITVYRRPAYIILMQDIACLLKLFQLAINGLSSKFQFPVTQNM